MSVLALHPSPHIPGKRPSGRQTFSFSEGQLDLAHCMSHLSHWCECGSREMCLQNGVRVGLSLKGPRVSAYREQGAVSATAICAERRWCGWKWGWEGEASSSSCLLFGMNEFWQWGAFHKVEACSVQELCLVLFLVTCNSPRASLH